MDGEEIYGGKQSTVDCLAVAVAACAAGAAPLFKPRVTSSPGLSSGFEFPGLL